MEASTDSALIRRYAEAREAAALDTLVARHLRLVFQAALRQLGGNGSLAEEVTQEVFVRLVRKAPALRDHTSLAGWLHSATRRVALETIRRETRRRKREEEAAVRHETETTGDKAAWEAMRPIIDAAIAELGPAEREAVLLRFFSGARFAEIGARIGLSENAARMRVSRALEDLRRRLERHGVTSTAAALGGAMSCQAQAVLPSALPSGVAGAIAAAESAGAASAWVQLIGLMKMSKVGVTTGALVLAIGGWVAVHFRQVRAEIEAERAELTASLAAAQSGQERRPEPNSANFPRPSANPPARAVAASAAAPESVRSERFQRGDQFLSRHPDVKQALAEYAQARFRFQFADFIQRHGLTEGQVAALAARRGIGMGSRDNNGQSLTLQHRAGETSERDKAELAILAEAALADYRREQQRVGARELAVKLAGTLAFGSDGLTAAQAEALTGVLERSARRAPGQPRSYDWKAVFAGATVFLNERQIGALKHLQAHQLYNEAFSRLASTTP